MKRRGAPGCVKRKKKPPETLRFRRFWRRSRDLNPGDGIPSYSLSRGAPSASWVLLQRYEQRWRRERDSNPRCLAASLVFKTSSINHSNISPRVGIWSIPFAATCDYGIIASRSRKVNSFFRSEDTGEYNKSPNDRALSGSGEQI